MDGRGGCCIARYVPGASHVSTMDTIMLRFRPIAPKPVAASTASDASSSESSDPLFKTKFKRRCVRDSHSKRRTRRRKNTSSSETKQTQKQTQKQKQPTVTLPLLPENPDRKDLPVKDLTPPVAKGVQNNSSNNLLKKNVAVWMSFENRSLTTKVEPYSAMMGGWCSSVTVECVKDTWVEGEWLGSTDEERKVRLSRDTCPGFISDTYGRVTWMNKAYCEMMKGEKQGTVLLVIKEGVIVPFSSFTCKVKVVQYLCGREENSLILPCDVWRMDSGGFAWRLDIKTALSLRLSY